MLDPHLAPETHRRSGSDGFSATSAFRDAFLAQELLQKEQKKREEEEAERRREVLSLAKSPNAATKW